VKLRIVINVLKPNTAVIVAGENGLRRRLLAASIGASGVLAAEGIIICNNLGFLILLRR